MNLAAVLLLATLVGPERPVAAPSYGPAYGTQYPHTLVSDGTDFLAIWTGTDGVYAAAVDESGAARPKPPHALFEGGSVRAAWAGDAYVLVWSDGQRTLTARMNREAQLISTPVVVADAASPMAIGALGNRTLVLVARYEDTTAVLLGPDGDVVRQDIALPTATRPYAASVVAAGGGFIVATVETTYAPVASSTVRATRISADGSAGPSATLIAALPHNVNSIHAASDGDRAGIAFVARRNMVNGPERLYAFTVDADTLAATAHAPRLVAGDDPQVVTTPGGFASGMLEKGSESAPLMLTTIPFATDARSSTPVGNAPGADLHMATNGRRVMSVWRDYRFSPPYEYSTMNMFGIALDATATQTETGVLPVAISTVAQGQPAIASADTTSLVAWMDLTKTVRGNVMARRFDARGNPLDAAPIELVADVEGRQQPVVTFTGEVWIVAWRVLLNANGNTRTYMRRIARNGTVLDPEPVDLGPGTAVAAASNGTVTLLAFDKWLLRFSRAGEQRETVTLPATAWGGGVASNGSDFLLVWTEGSDWWQFPSPNYIDVHAMRLDASGNPVGARIDVATSPANERSPVVTANGTDFLIAYAHIAGDERVVRAKRVLREGVLGDHTALQPGSLVGRGELSYSVAPRGEGYAAVFVRGVDGRTAAIDTVTLDARGAAVEEPVTLATTNWYSWSPWTFLTSTMVAYTRTQPELGNIDRVFVRGLGGEPPRRRTTRR
jgi:hypothetical protein